MGKQEEQIIVSKEGVEAQLTILNQYRQRGLYEVRAEKVAHKTGNVIDFGAREDVVAESVEVAKDLYKSHNPECSGADDFGVWRTVVVQIA